MSTGAPDDLAAENTRLRMLIGELLDNTGLDDAERAEWLDRSRLSESAVYPDDDDEYRLTAAGQARAEAETVRYALVEQMGHRHRATAASAAIAAREPDAADGTHVKPDLITVDYLKGETTVSWDYREQPPMEDIAEIIAQMTGGALRMTMSETGSDEYELVISHAEYGKPQPAPVSASQVRRHAEQPAPGTERLRYEHAQLTETLAKIRHACQRPEDVAGKTSGSGIVNGRYLAEHLLRIIGALPAIIADRYDPQPPREQVTGKIAGPG